MFLQDTGRLDLDVARLDPFQLDGEFSTVAEVV